MRTESAAENRHDLYSSNCLPSAERKKTLSVSTPTLLQCEE